MYPIISPEMNQIAAEMLMYVMATFGALAGVALGLR